MDKFAMKEEIRIKVLDFTEDPGPRYIRQDQSGNHTSGEAFYLNILNAKFEQAFREDKKLILELDGVSGYPSSFLDEAIGELVYDFTLEHVSKILDFNTRIYKRRVDQVKDETYLQWEKRRKQRDEVVHSPNINKSVFYINTEGHIDSRYIE